MSSLLKEVGAVAGLASFLGLALLALLYFAQARDVRRLRDQASFLVEGNEDGESVAPAERTATAVASTTKEPEKAAAAAAATAPNEAEAFRRAELARQAAQRRQRFEQRRKGPGRERPAWLPERLSLAVIVVGAILLVAGVAFGVTRITGGSSDSTTADGGQKSKGPCPPGQTKVAVLNGTATPGLAAQSAGPLKQAGYKVGPVGNTSTPFPTSVVMFDPTDGKECGPIVGQVVGIQKSQPMNNEVRQAAEGDPVAVVLGDDKAGVSTETGASATTGSGI
jgi:LytR cell envelope-related transcriptional attenuator